jgi:hypothetical protein
MASPRKGRASRPLNTIQRRGDNLRSNRPSEGAILLIAAVTKRVGRPHSRSQRGSQTRLAPAMTCKATSARLRTY